MAQGSGELLLTDWGLLLLEELATCPLPQDPRGQGSRTLLGQQVTSLRAHPARTRGQTQKPLAPKYCHRPLKHTVQQVGLLGDSDTSLASQSWFFSNFLPRGSSSWRGQVNLGNAENQPWA